MNMQSIIHPQLAMARRALRGNLMAIGFFSGVVNLLMLTGPIFMLQIYDRVLTSQSVNTLVALSVLMAGLYFFMGLIDAARSRVLVAMGHRFEQRLAATAFNATLSAAKPGLNNGNVPSAIRESHQSRLHFSQVIVVSALQLP